MALSKVGIVAVSVLVVAGGLLVFKAGLGERKRGDTSVDTGASGKEPTGAVTALQPEVARKRSVTELEDLRKTVMLAEAHMKVSRTADPETSAAEQARLQVEQTEKELVASMERLTAQVSSDPASVAEAVALLEAENDPALMMMLAQAIGAAADALGDKFPHEALLKMALNDPSLERRRAAITALGYMSKVPPELRDQIAEISRSGPDEQIRLAAIEAMGSWMNKNPQLIQTISEQLLLTREANSDPAIRGVVIQTIGNMDAPLSRKVFEAMAEAVVHEAIPHNRSLAALALGSGVGPESREPILATLESAYHVESNLDTQRHIITQITKAARYDAEDYLSRLPTPHPLLEQDVKDYIEILASVDRKDWGAIWNQKSERDHARGTYPGSHGGHGADDF